MKICISGIVYFGQDSAMQLFWQTKQNKELTRLESPDELKELLRGKNASICVIEEAWAKDHWDDFLISLQERPKGAGKSIPVILILNAPLDRVRYRQFRETLAIPYILEMPINNEWFDALVKNISDKESLAGYGLSERLPEELVRKYESSIFKQVDRMEELTRSFRDSKSLEALKSLRMEMHKVAGTAGSYGYTKAGLAAGRVELVIYQSIIENKTNNKNLLEEIEAGFKAIMFYYQIKERV